MTQSWKTVIKGVKLGYSDKRTSNGGKVLATLKISSMEKINTQCTHYSNLKKINK